MNDLLATESACAEVARDRYQHFMLAERRRFERTIQQITSRGKSSRVPDIDCFIPFVSLVLARFGFQVSAVVRYDYYGADFKFALKSLCSRYGVEVIDADVMQDPHCVGVFDEVLCLAVIEHLNASPRQLLGKITQLLGRVGALEIEVPNISEVTKPIRFLFSRSPLPASADYFASEYPFVRHNREMTVDEVRYMLEAGSCEVRRSNCHDCTETSLLAVMAQILYWCRYLAPLRRRGELIRATVRRAAGCVG